MNTNPTTIERTLTNDKDIYEAILNTMLSSTKENGDNITIDNLTDEVAKTVDMESAQLRPFVQHFARQTEVDGIGYVSNGRKGGWRRGPRPVETPRTKRINKSEIDTTTETNTQ